MSPSNRPGEAEESQPRRRGDEEAKFEVELAFDIEIEIGAEAFGAGADCGNSSSLASSLLVSWQSETEARLTSFDSYSMI